MSRPQTSAGGSHHRGVQTEGSFLRVHHQPVQVNVRRARVRKGKAALSDILRFIRQVALLHKVTKQHFQRI